MKLASFLPVAVEAEALPWHREALQRLQERQDSLAQVLLVSSAPGCGLEVFADALTARLLCRSPGPDGAPCGGCRDCRQWQADTHPDILTLRAEPERDIPVDEARQCIEQLQLARHYDGRRVVRIALAEQLNRSAANALLKTLEEPPEHTVFLLLAHQPRSTLPTIRSRAQKLHLPVPDAAQSKDWLHDHGVKDAEAALARAPDQPLRALAYTQAQDDVPDFEGIVDAWRRNSGDIATAVKALATSRESALAFAEWLATRSWQTARGTLAGAGDESPDEALRRFTLAQQCRSSIAAYTPPALALESLFVSWRELLRRSGQG